MNIKNIFKKFIKTLKIEEQQILVLGKSSKLTLGFHKSQASEGKNSSYSWFRL